MNKTTIKMTIAKALVIIPIITNFDLFFKTPRIDKINPIIPLT
ncbi:MAG: hypothetical protein ACFFD2_02695 [Promethearchaeota archaeon]